MLRKLLAFALLLLLSGCSGLQLQSDYDPAFNFGRLETFAVVYPENNGVSTLTQSRIADAVRTQMQKKGYREVPKADADFIVLFHTDVTAKRQVVTDYQLVGLYPYYGFGASMTVPVQREYSYEEGRIIVDALNPDGNRIFWRTTATDRLKSFDTPQERIGYIRKTVGEVLKSFPARGLEP